MKEWEEEGR